MSVYIQNTFSWIKITALLARRLASDNKAVLESILGTDLSWCTACGVSAYFLARFRLQTESEATDGLRTTDRSMLEKSFQNHSCFEGF